MFHLSMQWPGNSLKATKFGNHRVPSFVCHLLGITSLPNIVYIENHFFIYFDFSVVLGKRINTIPVTSF